jgi:hypothetical protein
MDNAIAVLRLLGSDYIGRGMVFGWVDGPHYGICRAAPSLNDQFIAAFNRGEDPDPSHPISAYQLLSNQIAEVKELLACVRNLVRSETNVAKVIRLIATRPSDWVNLYKVMEIVKGDAGSALMHTWASKRALGRFTNTANTAHATGDDARHAGDSFQAPAVPMTLTEAHTLIGGLARKWIESKC